VSDAHLSGLFSKCLKKYSSCLCIRPRETRFLLSVLIDRQARGRRTASPDCGMLAEESINDSVSVDLGICNPGAVGNNDLVVAVQR